MSQFYTDKISRLKSLTDWEKRVLDTLMADKGFKPKETADEWKIGESTVRKYLSNVFDKLGAPEDGTNKREWVAREYVEAYRDLYLRVGEDPQTPPEPKINVAPTNRRINQTTVIVAVLGGFLVISAIVIGGVLFTLNRINQPVPAIAATNTNSPSVAVRVDTAIPQAVIPTAIPTQVPTTTSVPPTNTPVFTPTPKAIYEQGELAYLRESVSIYLDKDFTITNSAACVPHDPGFGVKFWIENTGAESFLARFERSAFSAVDDTGKIYEIYLSGVEICHEVPGNDSSSFVSGSKQRLFLSFAGQIPLQAKYIFVTINDISGSGKIVFRKKL